MFSIEGKCCHPLMKRNNLNREGQHLFLERNRNRWLKSFSDTLSTKICGPQNPLFGQSLTQHTTCPPKLGKKTAVSNQIKYISRVSSMSDSKQYRIPYGQSRRKGTVSLILSWAGWSIWTTVFCTHMEPCPSEQRSLLYVLGFCPIFSVLWSEAMPICQFSDILWLLPLQSVWVHCQEARQCHRQRMPPLCRAWSRTTCQCHCKLCIKSHDWIPEEDLMPFHPSVRALRWLHRRKSLWEGETLFRSAEMSEYCHS